MTDYTPKADTSNTDGSVSSPQLSMSLKPKNRAIKDADQAKRIITSMEVNNRERNQKNSRIMAKYNSEKPFTSESLKQDGLDWKSNFTTKPLPMLIDKVAPRFVAAIQGTRFLTNASLPDDAPGAAMKTEAFRREITDTVRRRAGWQNFLTELSQENALFGFTGVGWLDEFHWFPKFFRQDEFLVPTNTKQHSNSAQLVVFKERFQMHELFALIEDKDAAETAGWKIKATVDAINKACPEDRRANWSNSERVYEDLIRESNVGMSHEAGARVINVWHLLATEVTGKVSHMTLEDVSFAELFSREDQFDSMADAVTFFTFQQGNSTVHGSKGIGREIYAMAGMLDRARNEIVDRLNLSGKLIIQAGDKDIKKFRMSVVGNTILIGKGYEVLDRKLNGDVEPFLALDQFLTGLLDQMAGATTPRVFEGERVTKAQVEFFAQREEESKDNIIARFLNQFADMMTTIQKRLCDKNTDDKDAEEMQERLLKIMTREELDKLAGIRVAETVKDYTEMERQQIIMIAAEARGNPLYNQRELEYRKVVAQLGEEWANAVILPEEDPTVLAEQTRSQMLEMDFIIRHAAQVPVSPRDNHLVHLGVLLPGMDEMAVAATMDPDSVATLQALLMHGMQHLQMAEQAGFDKEKLAPMGKTLKQLEAKMPELMKLAEQQKTEMEAAAAAPQLAPGKIGPNTKTELAPGEIGAEVPTASAL